MIDSGLKIGVLSRRPPIGQNTNLQLTVEHVGGLTRVLPALAEFARVDWTALTTQCQISFPKQYPFSKISGQNYKNEINIFLAEVSSSELNQMDWLNTHYIWPLMHDIPIPGTAGVDLDANLESIQSICQAMATKCVDASNDGYLVNDFQLSQVPAALKLLEPQKPISFFLHTPWPKNTPESDFALKILKFLATGMLSADVIEFQTQNDLQAFESFISDHLLSKKFGSKLAVNPVSIAVQDLEQQPLTHASSINLADDDISYVHIARSDPIKNTLAAIQAFTAVTGEINDAKSRSYLDVLIVPSRQQWPDYQKLLADIATCVDTCNSRLSSLDYSPIRLHIGNDYERASQALVRYDYLIACSLSDGLNLVVKEGAILNNRNGVIVSTAKVGAMAELGEFCIVAENANTELVARALLEARNLNYETRKNMSFELKRQVRERDASDWAESVIANFKVLEAV